MVRKSSRNAAKAQIEDRSSPEKTKPEVKRRSRRTKKVETSSESEQSEEEVEVKPKRTRTVKESPRKTTRTSRSSKKSSASEEPPAKLDATDEESTKTQSSEEDKLQSESLTTIIEQPETDTTENESKISESKDNKSNEEVAEVAVATVKEEENLLDEENNKKGKGKSKGKNKSNIENSTQQVDLEPQSQNEISENVQVTPVSPTRIDNQIDNDDPVTTKDETVQNIPQINSEKDEGKETIDDTEPNNKEQIVCDDNKECAQNNDPSDNKMSEDPPTEAVSDPVNQKECEEHTNSLTAVEAQEITISNRRQNERHHSQSESDTEQPVFDKNDSNQKSDAEVTKLEVAVNTQKEEAYTKEEMDMKEETNMKEENKSKGDTKEEIEAENSSATCQMDIEMKIDASKNDENPPSSKEEVSKGERVHVPEERKQTEEKMEEEHSDHDEKSESSTEPGEIPKEKLKLKRSVSKDQEVKNSAEVLKQWGDNIEDVEKYFNLIRLSTEDVQKFAENVEVLDEGEVKLEIVERISLQQRDKVRSDRKVSVEYNSETERPSFDTQLSDTSSYKNEDHSQDEENIIALNRKISIVDDTASKLKPPPSPAKNPVSAVLYITNLVRPFTLKQLKEMLERTGKIRENGLWTDRIKSKCLVYYETEEEAEATRNAIHGVNWPIGNGKKLVIEYSTPEELEKAQNPPTVPVPPPVVEEPAVIPEKENVEPELRKSRTISESENRDKEKRRIESNHVREWDVGKERSRRDRTRSRSRSRDRIEKKRHRRSPSPQEDFISRKQKKLEESVPQKLMDDLFQKTKTMPSIFWQPLSPEEISMKQQQRLQRMAEHKRRMEETSQRNRADFGRAGAYRRRYD